MTDLTLTLNGDPRRATAGTTIADLLVDLQLDPAKVAVERNRTIVPRSSFAGQVLADGDALEIVHFVGGGQAPLAAADSWTVAGRTFTSRLIVGTGKYRDYAQNAAAVAASGAEIVTVAVRRVNVMDRGKPMLTDFIDPKQVTYLPNTAGCFTADDAVRTLRLAREAGGWNLVKLEVLGEARTLYPDMAATLAATKELVRDGFDVMVYCADDPIAAKRLEELGACAIMPLGAPIGSRAGAAEPGDDPPDRRRREGAGAGRRRRRHGERRGHRHGAGLRRRPDEHRHRRGEGPGGDGPRDEAGGRGRAAGVRRGADGAADVCRPELAAGGADLIGLSPAIQHEGHAKVTPATVFSPFATCPWKLTKRPRRRLRWRVKAGDEKERGRPGGRLVARNSRLTGGL